METANARAQSMCGVCNTETARVNERTIDRSGERATEWEPKESNRIVSNRTEQKLIVWWNLHHILATCVQLCIDGRCSCWRQIKTQIEKRAVKWREAEEVTGSHRETCPFLVILSRRWIYMWSLDSAEHLALYILGWVSLPQTNSLNQLVLSHRIFTRCGWVIVRQASRRRHCRRRFA